MIDNGPVVDIPINNSDILNILDKYVEKLEETKNLNMDLDIDPEKRRYETSLEYLEHIKQEETGAGGGLNYYLKADKIHFRLMESLALNRNCLSFIYPPGGYIDWHSNGDVPGYGIIFTWSENGNGFWKHVDPTTKDIITIQDRPGWQCKAIYFGGFDEPENLVYHMAATDCWRITVSFLLKKHDRVLPLRETIINDIMDTV